MDEQRMTADGGTTDPADPAMAAATVPGSPVPTADEAAAPPSVQVLEQAVSLRGVDAMQHAQELLAEHVPLALLVDLLTPTGDTSADLLAAEGLPEDAWWQDGAAAPGDVPRPPAP
ncbi:hypothetical protein [Cellulomonas shaoxiangyii]|uniref:Uncharacterized protein n=1 Tax=Cellulomonas shaoxiangyii TaxID=2566013 RepID=A0A4V1CMT7_9CELL|nr:hypothetical protein [Cellulomonas shaoxiangyii]QCB94085.1 hypothetical protein E5225_11440 [Cellulomonas shaoxiangyii]TGY83753.1 hypothetical protein E5226_11840 [Cellulomonas shaoxiangyii]